MSAVVMTQNAWDDAVLRAGGSFFQSWEWGEFQKALGREVARIEGDGWFGQFVRMPLPFGRCYWYCPRGPLSKGDKKKKIPLFTRGERVGGLLADGVFIRIEPSTPEQIPDSAIKIQDHQPSHTVLVDLSLDEDELLRRMHPKTRYNIRLAMRHGVQARIVASEDAGATSAFTALLADTAQRDQFNLHPGKYYETLCATLSNLGRLAMAEHGGDILAAHFLVTFGDTATYLFGASSSLKRNLMAPYLAQWESIRFAKANGSKWFDFFGISDTNPWWAGLTRFKRSFGGIEVSYPGTFDIPNSNTTYRLYRILRRLWRNGR